MILLKKLVFFSFSICCAAVAFAQPDISVEPAKLNTDDAFAVKPGSWEAEFGYSLANGKHQNDYHGSRNHRGKLREHHFDWSLKTGLVDRFELNAAIGYANLLDKETSADGPVRGHGWKDIELGSKIEVVRGVERNFVFSYAPSVMIPSGRESREDRLGPGGDSTVIQQRVIFTKIIGRWSFDLDSGYGLPVGNRKGFRGTGDVNAAAGYQIFNWLQPGMELNYAHDFINEEYDADTFAMTWGAVMPIHERIRINSGVQQVLAGKNTDQTTTFSVVTTLFL